MYKILTLLYFIFKRKQQVRRYKPWGKRSIKQQEHRTLLHKRDSYSSKRKKKQSN